MRTKFICILVVIVMIAMLLPAVALADADNISGDYRYIVNNGGTTCTITGYTGSGGNLTIADTLETYTVTDIGLGAFFSKNLTGAVIPDTVTYIGVNAFSGNTMTEFMLPEPAEGNISIWAGVLPETPHIGGDIVSVTNEYTWISSAALYEYDVINENSIAITNYNGLGGNLVIPDTIDGYIVFGIEWRAFYDKDLTSVVIPDSVMYVEEQAFYANYASLPDSVGDGFTPNTSPSLTSFTLPGLYKGYTNTWYEYDLYSGDATIHQMGATVTNLESYYYAEFAFCDNGDDSATLVEYSGESESITIPTFGSLSKTHIGEIAFADFGITDVTLPNNVVSIGDYAFAANKLTSITIPDSITSIGLYAFVMNEGLTSYTLPDAPEGYTSIWDESDPGEFEFLGLGVNQMEPEKKLLPTPEVTVTQRSGGFVVTNKNCGYDWVQDVINEDTQTGNITGTLLDENGNPLVGYTVELHSDPITVVTNGAGEFTFTSVALTTHTLIIEDELGSVLGTYALNFEKGASEGHHVDGSDIDLTITSNTVMIDILISVDGDGVPAIEEVTFVANPSTGDERTSAMWMLWAAVFLVPIALYGYRKCQTAKK